jgi:hypothetical protein
LRMIPKSGHRFSEKIMRNQITARRACAACRRAPPSFRAG